ncbi:MAG: hypothetical protein ACXWE5_09215, partial [Actinomycetota bacterium]
MAESGSGRLPVMLNRDRERWGMSVGEALDMLQAMNTGHEGSLSTAHTKTWEVCISRTGPWR